MKNFIKEFKEFISRGNIIDLAVAVIIGGAFSAIVTALTQQIIMPLVNWALAAVGGKEGLESAYTILSPGYTDGVLDLTKSIYIDWGAFISAILNFFIIALVLFAIVKVVNRSKKRISSVKAKAQEKLNKELIAEKKEVRMQAKAEGKSFKTAWKEHLIQKEEAAKRAEEEKVAAEKAEAERAAKEREEILKSMNTTDKLLYEINEKLSKN
ncbi:MAG: large conductance mechanosensitive channel protein MscL [Clostridia bacterium]|nr:large conductance mechanosensitive channel protein MscL [Clostridia bacterium]